jgi:hypothetical protein
LFTASCCTSITTESTLASAIAAVAEEEPADDVAQGDALATARPSVGQPLRSRPRRHSSVLNSNKGVTPHGATAVKPLPGWALTPTTQVGHGSASSAIGQVSVSTCYTLFTHYTHVTVIDGYCCNEVQARIVDYMLHTSCMLLRCTEVKWCAVCWGYATRVVYNIIQLYG